MSNKIQEDGDIWGWGEGNQLTGPSEVFVLILNTGQFITLS